MNTKVPKAMLQPVPHSQLMAVACKNEKKMKNHGAAVIVFFVLDPIFSTTAGYISLNLICMIHASIMAYVIKQPTDDSVANVFKSKQDAYNAITIDAIQHPFTGTFVF